MDKKKNVFIVFVLLVLLSFMNLSAQEKVKPNVIFIVVDDLGWADLGCYGADLHETPNIDKLADASQMFTNAYSSAAVCTPTRASLMTGKYPARLNMTIWREWAINQQFDQKLLPPNVEGNLPLSEITIAEKLKEEGYVTAHLGKWHIGDGEHFPEVQGFDINVGANVWGCPPTFFYPYRGNIYDSERFVPGLEKSSTGKYATDREGEYLTNRLTDEALKIIEECKEKPFFLNLAYYSVHTPIEAEQDVVDYYQKKIKPEMKHQNPIYAAMVHAMDRNVGRILSKLDELNLTDNTVIVFISDNGGLSKEWDGKTVTNNYPLRSGKGSSYEGGLRVPTIIHWPGVTKPGSVCDVPISTQDFLPTILEIVGADNNVKVDGTSIVTLLENPNSNLEREALFWHYPHYYWPIATPSSTIRKGDWKLIEFYEGNRMELYNLTNDLGEQNNLAENRPEKVKELKTLLDNWRENVNASVPTVNKDYKE